VKRAGTSCQVLVAVGVGQKVAIGAAEVETTVKLDAVRAA
jgi:hypothetical protein